MGKALTASLNCQGYTEHRLLMRVLILKTYPLCNVRSE